MEDLLAQLTPFLDTQAERPGWLLAYSGGLDSSVALHLLWRYRTQHATAPPLRAVYVNHGLSPAAALWGEHCQRRCAELDVTFDQRQVDLGEGRGGLEAAARKARYRALHDYQQAGQLLFTAHHADDQVETLFLRLMRSSGMSGLSGMQRCSQLHGYPVARPLLPFSRQQLEAYARKHQLAWVEDESNVDTSLSRNFVRHKLLPLLRQQWPEADSHILSLVSSLRSDQVLLDEIGADDLAASERRNAWGMGLDIGYLAGLSLARQRNLVRAWLHRQGLPALRQRQWPVLNRELIGARDDSDPRLALGDGQLGRYQGCLYFIPSQARPAPENWSSEQGSAALQAEPVPAHGLRAGNYRLRYREGGETVQKPGVGTVALKQLLQEQGIPPWWRDRVPLLYAGEQLAAVADFIICTGFQAAAGEQGAKLKWLEGRISD